MDDDAIYRVTVGTVVIYCGPDEEEATALWAVQSPRDGSVLERAVLRWETLAVRRAFPVGHLAVVRAIREPIPVA